MHYFTPDARIRFARSIGALVARTLLAIPFFAGGLSYKRTAKIREDVARKLGIPAPELATRADAAVKLVGSVLLAAGVRPRVISAILAANLIPTTVGAHAFWESDDPLEREKHKQQFMLNSAIIGGLAAIATTPRTGTIFPSAMSPSPWGTDRAADPVQSNQTH
ncbi:DoxX family protein [Amycolatopsis pigmentata]|uniref:DoxX family protein n=1 Tax=Amycolatopsis pigmentata TaxID=450801 RepID=A0ABW5FN71_9PSEU